jgi:hypothetical protein
MVRSDRRRPEQNRNGGHNHGAFEIRIHFSSPIGSQMRHSLPLAESVPSIQDAMLPHPEV